MGRTWVGPLGRLREVETYPERAVSVERASSAFVTLGGRQYVQRAPRGPRTWEMPWRLVAPDVMELVVEGLLDAQLGLAGHGSGNVGSLHQVQGIPNHIAGHTHHDLGAVDQGQALLGSQLDGGDTGLLHGQLAAHADTLVEGLALAQHDQHNVAQRSQVAAGAQGTLLGDHGMDTLVEHIQHGLDGAEANAGMTLAQGIAAQQHGSTDHLLGQRFTHAAGMGNDQIPLEGSGQLLGDVDLGEFTEAGGQTVDHSLLLQLLVNIFSGLVDGGFGFRGHFDFLAAAGNRNDLLQSQVVTIDINHDCFSLKLGCGFVILL